MNLDPSKATSTTKNMRTSTCTLDEVYELFAEAANRPLTAHERMELQRYEQAYAASAARALPPTTAAEWLAAAIAAVAGSGAPLTVPALHPVLRSFVSAMPAAPAAPRPNMQQQRQLTEVWSIALSDLRQQVVPANFMRWLARTRLLSHAGNQAVVGAPDQTCAEQLSSRLDPLVRRALSEAIGTPLTVSYQVYT
jgi:hypothetical protein